MALVNYTMPFGSIGGPSWATISPLHNPPHATAVNSLLYGPPGPQENDLTNDQHDYFKNSPYAPPQSHYRQQQQQNGQYRQRSSNNYLPPSVPTSKPPPQSGYQNRNAYAPPNSRTYGEGSYSNAPPAFSPVQNNGFYNPNFKQNTSPTPARQTQAPTPTARPASSFNNNQNKPSNNQNQQNMKPNQSGFPSQPPTYTKVQAGKGSKTQLHAVLDYDDDDEYYEDTDDPGARKPAMGQGGANSGRGGSAAGKGSPKDSRFTPVTPIQGPIFIQNDSVPVLPLYAYPKLYNDTLVQIPIWWTALSLALGLNVRGDVIRGVPCIKKFHQLFCPTAGNSYPFDKIDTFIDENKALMKRMYGYFEAENEYGSTLQQGSTRKRKRMLYPDDMNPPNLPDLDELYGPPGSGPDPVREADHTGDSYFNNLRNKRQTSNTSRTGGKASAGATPTGAKSDTGRVDACESKVEIVTPYWASNSAGKIRAIVNTQHFEQAIHQEVCSKVQTNRCAGECGCEQKYKWHRLLAYDPDNDCKGIFMDWFLFPSCCVCRCNPL